MQQVNTLDISFVATDAVDGNVRIAVGGLRRELLKVREHIRQALRSHIGRPNARWDGPLSGYYAGAYDRADAAVPITTLRAFIGTERP